MRKKSHKRVGVVVGFEPENSSGDSSSKLASQATSYVQYKVVTDSSCTTLSGWKVDKTYWPLGRGD